MGVEVSWIPGQGTKIPDASRPKKKKDNAVALSIVMTLCTHHTISRVCSSSQGESLYPLNSLLFFVLFCLFCFFFFDRSILAAVMGIDTNSERNVTKATRGKS